MASTVVVSEEVLGVALGWLDPVVVGVVAAVKGLAIVVGLPVSVRSTSVGPSVGHGLCTVLPNCVGVSERVGDNAAEVTAL